MILRRLRETFRSLSKARPQIELSSVLSGTFELRVDRLVGTVTDGFGTEAENIWVDVRHNNVLLDTVAGTRLSDQGFFNFSFDIQGRFTGHDLVKETVRLTARDGNGNSGRLRLDGAAQLELIRDHLGAPAVTLLNLDFSHQGNAQPYLGAGWSAAEEDFTWTEDDNSIITFDTPGDAGQYALRLTAGAFLNKPELSTQQLNISIDDTQVTQIHFHEAFAQFHECRFSHQVFGTSGRSILRLDHPDAARPSDIFGSRDQRRLSFNFRRLSIARMLPVEA